MYSIRGLLLEEKPELKRVLEQRRLEQDREKELALRPPSDLEQELRKRQLRLQEVRLLASLCMHWETLQTDARNLTIRLQNIQHILSFSLSLFV